MTASCPVGGLRAAAGRGASGPRGPRFAAAPTTWQAVSSGRRPHGVEEGS
ncbi:hypothetical protein ACL02T_29645 [Pseudonocardia sp. RS010]